MGNCNFKAEAEKPQNPKTPQYLLKYLKQGRYLHSRGRIALSRQRKKNANCPQLYRLDHSVFNTNVKITCQGAPS